MKKYLMMAAVLVGQLFAMEEPLPVEGGHNAITAAWISEEHFDIPNLAAVTGVTNLEDAKAIWLGQKDFARRILFFNEEGHLFATGTCGPMPFHVYPATQGENGEYQFASNQSNIPQAYRNLLVGTFTVEDLFEKPNYTEGLTWRIRQIHSEDNLQEISAISPFVKVEDPSMVAKMHKAAFSLPRLPLKNLGRPSLYVAMVRAIPGITEQDFGSDLTLSTELYDYYPGDDYKYHLLTGVFL
jgi:hypothetical protein